MAKNLVNSNNIEVVTSDDDLSLDFSTNVKQKLEQIETNKDDIQDLKNKTINIVTGGQAVPTGRKIDGKTEYIKRINLGSLPNAVPKNFLIGLTVNQQITNIYIYGMSSTNEYIPIPRVVSNTSYINYYINASETNLQLSLIPTMDLSRFTGYMEITYIDK